MDDDDASFTRFVDLTTAELQNSHDLLYEDAHKFAVKYCTEVEDAIREQVSVRLGPDLTDEEINPRLSSMVLPDQSQVFFIDGEPAVFVTPVSFDGKYITRNVYQVKEGSIMIQ